MSNPSSSPLLSKLRSYRYFWIVVFFITFTDQLTKYIISSSLPLYHTTPTASIPLIPNFLYLIHVHNTGAAWSLFAGYPKLLGLFGLVVLLFFYFFRKSLQLQYTPFQIIFGLLCGGTLGNIIDRLRFGYVIDFIDIHLPHYRWPAFNIADCAISTSIVIYLLYTFGFFKIKSNS